MSEEATGEVRSYIVPDANTLFEDFFLTRPRTARLLDYGARSGRVRIGQITVDELCGQYRRRMEAEISRAHNSLNTARRLSSEAGAALVPTIPENTVERAASAPREAFLKRLDEFGIEVLPYPRVSLGDLVARDVRGLRPFALEENTTGTKDCVRTSEGRGYRDYLFWRSVVELAFELENDDVVVVVTNDRDFRQGSDDTLHEDLAAELEEEGIPIDAIILRSGLDAASELYLSAADLDNALRDRLASGVYPFFNLETWMDGYAGAALGTLDDASGLNLPDESDGVTIDGFQDIRDIEVNSVSRLTDGQVAVEFSARATAHLDFFLPKYAYWGLDNKEEGISVNDSDWNEWVVWLATTRDVRCEITLIMDPDAREVRSAQGELWEYERGMGK